MSYFHIYYYCFRGVGSVPWWVQGAAPEVWGQTSRPVGELNTNRSERQAEVIAQPTDSIDSNSSVVNPLALTRRIPLTRGLFALVDDSDYDQLAQHKWCAQIHKPGNHTYAVRSHGRIQMHCVILNAPVGMEVDHINGNGLDNRRSNLRLASHAENQHNRKLNRNNTSGYKGVHWHKYDHKWRAEIRVNSRRKFLGYFNNKIDAALAYNAAALELHGPFAKLNEIETQTRPQVPAAPHRCKPNQAVVTSEETSGLHRRASVAEFFVSNHEEVSRP